MIDILTVSPIIVVVLILAGILAGILSGLLGIGGGLVYSPVGYFVLTYLGYPEDTALLTAFGVSLAAALPTVLTSAVGHTRNGTVSWKTAVVMGVSGMILGFFGGVAATYLPVRVLTIVFAVVLVLAGIRMILNLPTGEKTTLPVPVSGAIGAVGGFFSGLLGVGGGTILVPLMTIFGKFSIKRATGVSAAAIVFITVGGLVSYLINGYFDPVVWLLLTVPAIPFSYLASAKLSGKIPERVLRYLFFALMIVIALKVSGVFDLAAGLF